MKSSVHLAPVRWVCAKALGGLNHLNIVAIYGVQDRGAVPAIIMQLVGGEDLSKRIERNQP